MFCIIISCVLTTFLGCVQSLGDDRCNMRIEPGPCEAYYPSFGYDTATGQCRFFVYGGCHGNENRFFPEEACEEICEDDPCKMLIDSGPCRATIPRVGYNKTSGQCVPFVYGGCKGNTNNYKTFEQCHNQCEDVCNKPIEKGDCDGIYKRYAYNKTSGQCERFNYGGCGGNGNNFKIEKDCEDKCEAGCDKPIDSGEDCLSPVTRWGYNKRTGQCQQFTYNGCLGNGNNYETEEECKDKCED